MSDTIIRVENLGKKYIIGHQQEGRSRYVALRDVIANGAKSLLKRIQNPKSKIQNNYEEFWALKDVSFEVKQGEVIGIIGRNGAGKSTLLKILSRITEPTTGCISLKGRVASLLEVGTGFHPELTGRENIYLNGVILGMSKAEIKKKFDEIVAFAEVEKFLDTPVKRYSSGMYVRLAFAVAAHLEPEILVVDEVLAVGDAAFQKKCLGKMGDVATKDGRTVLFVSHNMAAIESLCKRCIYIAGGKIKRKSRTEEVLLEYLSNNLETNTKFSSTLRSNLTPRSGSGIIRIVNFAISNLQGKVVEVLQSGKSYTFHFHYEIQKGKILKNVAFAFGVTDQMCRLLFRNSTTETKSDFNELCDYGQINCYVPRIPLSEGRYYIGFRVCVNQEEADYIQAGNSIFFDVYGGNYYGSGLQSNHAPVLVEHSWNCVSK